jgi:hypothetical protein
VLHEATQELARIRWVSEPTIHDWVGWVRSLRVPLGGMKTLLKSSSIWRAGGVSRVSPLIEHVNQGTYSPRSPGFQPSEGTIQLQLAEGSGIMG